jgi:hypothetical protein
MKRLAFAIGVLALGFTAATPARADFAVMKFETGFCRIYWDSSAKPWIGTGTVVAKAATWEAAWAAQSAAVQKGKCK